LHQLTNCPLCNATIFASFIKTTAQMHSSKELFNFDQCRECKFVFLNPRVALDQLKNYYTSYYLPYRGANAWGKFEQLVEKSQLKLDLRRVKRVKETHVLTPASLILDIGCGRPSFLKACQQKLNCLNMGIDFTDEGWKDQSADFAGIDLQVSEIKDLPSTLQPDVITMWHYLEHDYSTLENLNYLKSILSHARRSSLKFPISIQRAEKNMVKTGQVGIRRAIFHCSPRIMWSYCFKKVVGKFLNYLLMALSIPICSTG
jgi:hypothetical protein